jgi:hypothetical protein
MYFIVWLFEVLIRFFGYLFASPEERVKIRQHAARARELRKRAEFCLEKAYAWERLAEDCERRGDVRDAKLLRKDASNERTLAAEYRDAADEELAQRTWGGGL